MRIFCVAVIKKLDGKERRVCVYAWLFQVRSLSCQFKMCQSDQIQLDCVTFQVRIVIMENTHTHFYHPHQLIRRFKRFSVNSTWTTTKKYLLNWKSKQNQKDDKKCAINQAAMFDITNKLAVFWNVCDSTSKFFSRLKLVFFIANVDVSQQCFDRNSQTYKRFNWKSKQSNQPKISKVCSKYFFWISFHRWNGCIINFEYFSCQIVLVRQVFKIDHMISIFALVREIQMATAILSHFNAQHWKCVGVAVNERKKNMFKELHWIDFTFPVARNISNLSYKIRCQNNQPHQQ